VRRSPCDDNRYRKNVEALDLPHTYCIRASAEMSAAANGTMACCGVDKGSQTGRAWRSVRQF
jgi:hypothetical protein